MRDSLRDGTVSYWGGWGFFIVYVTLVLRGPERATASHVISTILLFTYQANSVKLAT